MDLLSLAKDFAITAEGIGGAIFFWRLIRFIVRYSDALDSLVQMRPQVTQIVGQLLPNGGSSIVDRVAKVEDSCHRLEQGHTKLDKNYAELKEVNDHQLERLMCIEKAVNELTRDNHPET